MNCKDCVFSSRRIVINEYVDWCSHNKSQKEITKDTVICENFIKRNKTDSLNELSPIPIIDETPPEIKLENPAVITPLKEISQMDRRDLAFEAEKAMKRLMNRKDIQEEMAIIQAFLEPIVENEREKAFKEKLHITTSFKNFTPSKEISKIIHVLNNSIHHYQSAQEDLKKYQRGQQDILHAFELTDLSDDELMEYTRELQKNRIYRRQAKNFIETMEPLYQFALNNQPLIEQLKKVNSHTDKIKLNIESRKYYVREDTSLKQAFEKAEPLYKRMNEVVTS